LKFHLIHLGCQMNQSDAERIKAVLKGMGIAETDNEEEANILGIVSCSVRQKSIDRVYSKIEEWNARKDRSNLLTCVSGCILPADEPKFLKRFDLLFRIHEIAKLPDMIRQYGVVTPASLYITSQAQTNDPLGGFWKVEPDYSSPFEAYVPIQNGCDKFCTFCAVPYTRGREVSRPSDDILAEVERLIQRGVKSITLLGQNVNSYGLDKAGKEMTFAQLLRSVAELGRGRPPFWVYFTSPHPRDMSTQVLQTIAEHPVLAKQIHLPLQSGDDKVLIRMNRNHSMERYRELVHQIRHILPTATLFTDIIVGFSGETQEQFENTQKAMEEFQYNMAYIALYSPRPGAASSRWPDDVPQSVKKARLAQLTEVLRQSSGDYNREQVGKIFTVLVDGKDRKGQYLSARTEGKIPLRLLGPDELIGQFVQVRITKAADLSLEAELCEEGLRSVSPQLEAV